MRFLRATWSAGLRFGKEKIKNKFGESSALRRPTLISDSGLGIPIRRCGGTLNSELGLDGMFARCQRLRVDSRNADSGIEC